MMISTKGRYALRVMIDIAEHQHDGYIPLKEIAARQEISEKYEIQCNSIEDARIWNCFFGFAASFPMQSAYCEAKRPSLRSKTAAFRF